ncbi:Predicted ATP-dependent carboligase, ATP-grasp superfamily [Halobiforma haloterrestris]|uniref:Predicted ATP-dependent carboligase, ATP-grasp superfamily n=2 Tax=Natronobacterium haloterrestre TaxID=148448 RepID=A0A1I1F0E5_NATHA|nr:Predicted ATP-dependent carboligase, ATP-grasp superfamily [Halobiforma haloterrestris]
MAKADEGTIDADGEPMAVADDWADSSVAVPAITAPSTLACFRSLGGRDGTDVRTIALAERDGIPATRSRYCDETVPVPSPHENLIAYKDALLSVAMRPDVRTIIPVRDVDVYVLAKYKDEFDGYVSTPWPDLETLAAVQDRVQLFDAAEAAGVSVPDTALLDSTDNDWDWDWDWDREWIVKARYSILVDEYVDRCTPAEYLDPPKTEYLPPGEEPDVDRLRREMNHVPLLQEYVPTTEEYGFFALYDHGEPVATFQHRQLRGYSYAGGASSFRESVRIPALEEAGRDLLDHLEWHGLAMVEFLRDDETGEFKLMEINPRFWSSLPFSVQAGADFPYYYWQLANGKRAEIDHEYEAGLAGHLLRGELLYLRSILVDDVELAEKPSFWSAVGEIAHSIVEHPRFDCASITDMRPFVRDMLDAYDAYK